MRKESKKFLRDYLNANAPTGFETAGQKVWLEYLKPYINEYEVDVYGSVVGIVNPGKDYKVVLEAHADEIAWFVNYIDEKGYILSLIHISEPTRPYWISYAVFCL